MQNLLVLAPDRLTFDGWLREFGMIFKGTQVSYISKKEDLPGWGKNTYWTRLPDATCPSPNGRVNYIYIDHEVIEEAVKKKTSRRGFRPINF
jgi:hypothetical protein